MKTLFGLVLIIANFAYACPQGEAQVSGIVKSIELNSNKKVGGCLSRIDFDYFQPHALLPLDRDDVANQDIRTSCAHKVGERVSTYLVANNCIFSIED